MRPAAIIWIISPWQLSCFSLSAFKIFFFQSLVFRSLTMICLSVDFFGLIPFGVCSTSWIYKLRLLPNLVNFHPLLLGVLFSASHFLFSCRTLMTQMLDLLLFSTGPQALFFFFFFRISFIAHRFPRHCLFFSLFRLSHLFCSIFTFTNSFRLCLFCCWTHPVSF